MWPKLKLKLDLSKFGMGDYNGVAQGYIRGAELKYGGHVRQGRCNSWITLQVFTEKMNSNNFSVRFLLIVVLPIEVDRMMIMEAIYRVSLQGKLI